MEEYTSTYGIPERIITRQGIAFTGKEFRKICGRLNIVLEIRTPNLHTRTGPVERTIGLIKQIIKALASEKIGLKGSVRSGKLEINFPL